MSFALKLVKYYQFKAKHGNHLYIYIYIFDDLINLVVRFLCLLQTNRLLDWDVGLLVVVKTICDLIIFNFGDNLTVYVFV